MMTGTYSKGIANMRKENLAELSYNVPLRVAVILVAVK